MWQRSFRGIHEKHDAVNHSQCPFHFAAEIGVARSIHDIDLDVVVVDGRVFRQDRDAALALQIQRIHHPLGDLFVGAENAALVQQAIDQGGLTVIDVRDDRYVADVVAPNCLVFEA